MPKSTFNNLSNERKKEILRACRAEFEEHRLGDASVANVINRLGIARGTFYKYFKDIEDCYFYILSIETEEIHDMFFSFMKESEADIVSILKKYGKRVADEIHREDKYQLYKNRYLGWTPDLQSRWEAYCHNKQVRKTSMDLSSSAYSKEMMHLVKAVIHNLVERNFTEGWTKKKFLKKYKKQMDILRKGIGR